MFLLGCEVLLKSADLQKQLQGRRVALLAHPAAVTGELQHTLDALLDSGVNVVCAFGPQHGMRGEKQDNMIESQDYEDPIHGIPVFSLYGEVRRPTTQMMSEFDILLVDLQDVGCRIYTFLTTLFYMMDACEKNHKELWVLDRPNPAGRPIEGNLLDMHFASFVGAAPLPMRHGLTLGEAGQWYHTDYKGYSFPYRVIAMQGYEPTDASHGWPQALSWVNPSPNMPRLSCVRQYPGTVMVEATNLSEGRGTTTPLEVFGAPTMDSPKVIGQMQKLASEWFLGCRLRPCFYEPTFHKYKTELVSGIQIHVDGPWYNHEKFKPYRLLCLFFKAFSQVHPEFDLWRKPPYEYEVEKMPIDIVFGSGFLRDWVSESSASAKELDSYLSKDESQWRSLSRRFHLY